MAWLKNIALNKMMHGLVEVITFQLDEAINATMMRDELSLDKLLCKKRNLQIGMQQKCEESGRFILSCEWIVPFKV